MKLKTNFDRLKKRIIKHRINCKGWNSGKPCFDCHRNTLTPIQKAIEEIEWRGSK
jgi:hypothetical protein